LINGLLGSGGGVVLVTAMTFLFNLHDHKAHATAISIILPLTIISSLIYIKSGNASLEITIIVTLGSMIGAYIGSKILNRIPINIIRRVFGSMMIITAIGMMFY